MITRGRHYCLGNGKLSAFVDNIIVPANSNEPLHFLYPRWSQTASSVRQAHSSALRPSSSGLSLHKSHDRFPPCKSKPPRLLSTQAGNNPDSVIDNPSATTTPTTEPQNGAANNSKSSSDSSSSSEAQTNRGQDTPENRPTRPFRKPELTQTQKKLSVAKRVRDAEVKRLERRPYKERMKAAYRNHVQGYRRLKGLPTNAPHWSEVMALLEEMCAELPKESSQTNRKEIFVREETVAHLCGMPMSDENIWDVSARNGCRIRVLDLSESKGMYRRAVISGSTRALELVETRIRKIEHSQEDQRYNPKNLLGIHRPPMPIIPSILALHEKGAPVPVIRCVWDDVGSVELEPLKELDPAWRVPAYSVPGFTWYVDQLIRRQSVARSLAAQSSKKTIDVERSLVTLFTRPELKPYFSTGALNLALEYLCRHEHLSSARLIFNQSLTVATTESYNIFFRSTARRQDLIFLKTLLQKMQTLGVRPNGQTWIAFLQCLISPSPRHQVMVRMRELGLLKDRRVLWDVLEYNIDIILTAHFRDGGDISSFLESLEKIYGKDAVSIRLLNLILTELAPSREDSRLVEALNAFKKYQLTPSNKTINLAFTFFRSFYMAIPALSQVLQTCESFLSASNYEKMFTLALRSKSYNACRVIWTYACMRGMTSPLMRHMVLKSLRNHAADQPLNTKKLSSYLGAVVAGLRYREKDITHSGHIQAIVPAAHAETPVLYATAHMNASDLNRLRLNKRLITDDIKYGKTREPVVGLFLMLDAAIRLDREIPWFRTGENDMQGRPLAEILDLMMEVPCRERSSKGQEAEEDEDEEDEEDKDVLWKLSMHPSRLQDAAEARSKGETGGHHHQPIASRKGAMRSLSLKTLNHLLKDEGKKLGENPAKEDDFSTIQNTIKAEFRTSKGTRRENRGIKRATKAAFNLLSEEEKEALALETSPSGQTESPPPDEAEAAKYKPTSTNTDEWKDELTRGRKITTLTRQILDKVDGTLQQDTSIVECETQTEPASEPDPTETQVTTQAV
ncbi:Putative membrane protein ycf1 [Talaromyces islandicus]|uniref:Putative membrane protein ycf1 n=1 Tax=Talaromyces islandicus TaxID=28573 RepID=A0A0U1LPR3_TALIS|nr:Putative membrane protein ycf1 [Talaromyces islandicus]